MQLPSGTIRSNFLLSGEYDSTRRSLEKGNRQNGQLRRAAKASRAGKKQRANTDAPCRNTEASRTSIRLAYVTLKQAEDSGGTASGVRSPGSESVWARVGSDPSLGDVGFKSAEASACRRPRMCPAIAYPRQILRCPDSSAAYVSLEKTCTESAPENSGKKAEPCVRAMSPGGLEGSAERGVNDLTLNVFKQCGGNNVSTPSSFATEGQNTSSVPGSIPSGTNGSEAEFPQPQLLACAHSVCSRTKPSIPSSMWERVGEPSGLCELCEMTGVVNTRRLQNHSRVKIGNNVTATNLKPIRCSKRGKRVGGHQELGLWQDWTAPAGYPTTGSSSVAAVSKADTLSSEVLSDMRHFLNQKDPKMICASNSGASRVGCGCRQSIAVDVKIKNTSGVAMACSNPMEALENHSVTLGQSKPSNVPLESSELAQTIGWRACSVAPLPQKRVKMTRVRKKRCATGDDAEKVSESPMATFVLNNGREIQDERSSCNACEGACGREEKGLSSDTRAVFNSGVSVQEMSLIRIGSLSETSAACRVLPLDGNSEDLEGSKFKFLKPPYRGRRESDLALLRFTEYGGALYPSESLSINSAASRGRAVSVVNAETAHMEDTGCSSLTERFDGTGDRLSQVPCTRLSTETLSQECLHRDIERVDRSLFLKSMPTGGKPEGDVGGLTQHGTGAPPHSLQKRISDGVPESMVSEPLKRRERLPGDPKDVKAASPPTLLEQLTAAAAAVAASGKSEPVQGKGEEPEVNGTTVSVSGELVSAADVREWRFPNMDELYELRSRLLRLMREHRLKQADVCRFTGLAAPYISFMVKDPSVANFSNRRRIEVYSILSAFFEKIDSQVVTPNDIAQLVFVSKATARAANSRKRAQHQLVAQAGSASVTPRVVLCANLPAKEESVVGGCFLESPNVKHRSEDRGALVHLGGPDASQLLGSSKEDDEAEGSKGIQVFEEKRDSGTRGRRLDKIERDRTRQADKRGGAGVSSEAIELRQLEAPNDALCTLEAPYIGLGCEDHAGSVEAAVCGAGQEATAGSMRRRRRGRPRGTLGGRVDETFYDEGEGDLEVDHNSWVPYFLNTNGDGLRSSAAVLHGMAKENHVSLSRKRRRRKAEGRGLGGNLKRQELDEQLCLAGKEKDVLNCGGHAIVGDDGWRLAIVDPAITGDPQNLRFKLKSAGVPGKSTTCILNARADAANTICWGKESGVDARAFGEPNVSSALLSTSITATDVSPLDTVLPLLYECGLSHLLLSAEEQQEPGRHTMREEKRSAVQTAANHQEKMDTFSHEVSESDNRKEERSSAVTSQSELYEVVRQSLIQLQSEFNRIPRDNLGHSLAPTVAENTKKGKETTEGRLRFSAVSNGHSNQSAESIIPSWGLLKKECCSPLHPSCEGPRARPTAGHSSGRWSLFDTAADQRFSSAAIPLLLCGEMSQSLRGTDHHEDSFSHTYEKLQETDKTGNDIVQWLFRNVEPSHSIMDSGIQQQRKSSSADSDSSVGQTETGTGNLKVEALHENHHRQLGALLQALLETSEEVEQKKAIKTPEVLCSQVNFEEDVDADAVETPTKKEHLRDGEERSTRPDFNSITEMREHSTGAAEWASSQRYFELDSKAGFQRCQGKGMCSLLGPICFGPGWKKEVGAVLSDSTGGGLSCSITSGTAGVENGFYVSPRYRSPIFISQHSARTGSGDLTASASTRPSTDDDDTDEITTLSPRCSGLGTPDFFSSSLGCGGGPELPGFMWPIGGCDGSASKKRALVEGWDSVICALPRSGRACVLRFCWEHEGRLGDEDVVWDLDDSEIHLECFVQQYAQEYHIPVDPVGRGLLQNARCQLSAARSLEAMFSSVCQHLLSRLNFDHVSHLPGITRKILLDCFHQNLRVIDAVTWNLTHGVQDIKMFLQSLMRDLNLSSSFFMVLFPCFLRAVTREKVNFVYECGELMKKTTQNAEPLQSSEANSPPKNLSSNNSGFILPEGSARLTRRTRVLSPLKKDVKETHEDQENQMLDRDVEPITLMLEKKTIDEADHSISAQDVDNCGTQSNFGTINTFRSSLLPAAETVGELPQCTDAYNISEVPEGTTSVFSQETMGDVSERASQLATSIFDVTVSCRSMTETGEASEKGVRAIDVKQSETLLGRIESDVEMTRLTKTEEEPDAIKRQGPSMGRAVAFDVKTEDGDAPRCHAMSSASLTPSLAMPIDYSPDRVDQRCKRIPFPLRLKQASAFVAPRAVVPPLSCPQEVHQTPPGMKAGAVYTGTAEQGGVTSQEKYSCVSNQRTNILPFNGWVSADDEGKVRSGSCDIIRLVDGDNGQPEGPVIVRNTHSGPFNLDVMAAAALYPKICLASAESRAVYNDDGTGALPGLQPINTSRDSPRLAVLKTDGSRSGVKPVFGEGKRTT